MGPFFRKDLLVFWRDRKEILLALFLPVIIIIVLNTAMDGLFSQDTDPINIDVAIVQEDDEALGLEQFKERVEVLGLSLNEKEALLEQAAQVKPIDLIRNYLVSPELKELLSTQDLTETEATRLVEEGDIDAIVKIPEGFSNGVLTHLILDEQTEMAVKIQADEQSTELNILQEIVHHFVDTLNLQFAIGTVSSANMMDPDLPLGGIEMIEGTEPFNMTHFFTIAMSTLFALFISQTVALKTVTEKRERVFNRILLTNSKPLYFLMGKVFSTFCFAWLQVMTAIVATQLILDVFPGRIWEFWMGLIAVITAFSLTVAGLSAIFTSLSLSLHDPNAVSGITTLIIMAMAFLGGNFFPIQNLPTFIQRIGEWTPNGLTHSVLIGWIQYSDIQELILPIIMLVSFFVICVIVGIILFPRRGRI